MGAKTDSMQKNSPAEFLRRGVLFSVIAASDNECCGLAAYFSAADNASV